MKNKVSYCTAIFILVIGSISIAQAQPPEELQKDNTSICHDTGSQLPFDIKKEARWKMTLGEQYHPISVLSKPRLYEICRNGALISGPLRVATDTGVQSSTELPRCSCVVVYSKRIGIFSPQEITSDNRFGGTYRVLDAASDQQYDAIIHVQAQLDSNEAPKTIVATELSYGNVPDIKTRSATYRYCHEDYKLTTGKVRGIKIYRTPDYIDQLPFSRDPALLGPGSCVDFSGSNIHLVMANEPNPPVGASVMCGKIAYKLDSISSD